jgi:hypothetical protein
MRPDHRGRVAAAAGPVAAVGPVVVAGPVVAAEEIFERDASAGKNYLTYQKKGVGGEKDRCLYFIEFKEGSIISCLIY